MEIFKQRTKLFILEKLSDGQQYSRHEIYQYLKNQGIIFPLFKIHFEALTELVESGKIDLINGTYIIPRKNTSQGT